MNEPVVAEILNHNWKATSDHFLSRKMGPGHTVLYCANNLISKGHLQISWLKPYLNFTLAIDFLLFFLQTVNDTQFLDH